MVYLPQHNAVVSTEYLTVQSFLGFINKLKDSHQGREYWHSASLDEVHVSDPKAQDRTIRPKNINPAQVMEHSTNTRTQPRLRPLDQQTASDSTPHTDNIQQATLAVREAEVDLHEAQLDFIFSLGGLVSCLHRSLEQTLEAIEFDGERDLNRGLRAQLRARLAWAVKLGEVMKKLIAELKALMKVMGLYDESDEANVAN